MSWPAKGAKWQGQHTKATVVQHAARSAVAGLLVVAGDSIHLSLATRPQQDRHACQDTAPGLDGHDDGKQRVSWV